MKYPLELATVLVYFGVFIGIGFLWKQKADESWESFYLANRELSLPLYVGTMVASMFSGVVFLGDPEVGWTYGFVAWYIYGWVWLVGRLPLAWVGGALRQYMPPTVQTLPDMMEHLYDRKCSALAAMLALGFTVGRFIAQILSVAFLFNFLLGLPMNVGLLLGAIIISVYVLLSGLWGVVITDVVQLILMLMGMGIVGFMAFRAVGGFPGLVASLPATHLTLLGGKTWSYWLIMCFAMSMYAYGDPMLYQRFIAAKDKTTARNGFFITVLFWLMLMFISVTNGMSARVLFYPDITNVETAMFSMFTAYLPHVLGALFIGAVLCACMSTADTYILLAAAFISKDIYAKYINPKADDKKLIFVTRVFIPIVVAIGAITATLFPGVWDAWITVVYSYGPVVFAPVVLGIVWMVKGWKMSRSSGFASMLAGLTFFVFRYGFGMAKNPSFLISIALSTGVFVVINALHGVRMNWRLAEATVSDTLADDRSKWMWIIPIVFTVYGLIAYATQASWMVYLVCIVTALSGPGLLTMWIGDSQRSKKLADN